MVNDNTNIEMNIKVNVNIDFIQIKYLHKLK